MLQVTQTLISHTFLFVVNCTKVLEDGSFALDMEMHRPEFDVSGANFSVPERGEHYLRVSSSIGVQQMAVDWISGNWYFLDDAYDRLFVCRPAFDICVQLFSGKLEKPKDMALDPSEG